MNEIEEKTKIDGTEYVTGEDITYSTGEVASMLGISRDNLRYIIKPFIGKYIAIDRTSAKESSHWRIHSKDIELIRTIIRLRKQGRTTANIQEMLDDPGLALLLGEGTNTAKAIADVLTKNNELLIKSFSNILSGINESYRKSELKHLENSEQLQSQNSELQEKVQYLSNQVEELKNLINEKLPEKKKFSLFRRN